MRIEIARAAKVNVGAIIAESAYSNTATAKDALFDFLRRSVFSYVGTIDEKIACVYGLIAPTLMSDQGYLWLLTTNLVDDHPFVFVRHSQVVIKDMLEIYSEIVGHCDIRQERSVKWLRWLGAKFGESEGVMIPFQIRAKNG
jgi:hypothetical protein